MTKELQQTPIPEEFTKVMHARAVQYGGGRSGYESFTDGAEWAYRLLSSQGLRWVKVEDGQPKLIEGKDYSDRVFVICDGKLMIMTYVWIDEGSEEGLFGYVWANCYGNINGEGDWDDDYKPTHWMKLPEIPKS